MHTLRRMLNSLNYWFDRVGAGVCLRREFLHLRHGVAQCLSQLISQLAELTKQVVNTRILEPLLHALFHAREALVNAHVVLGLRTRRWCGLLTLLSGLLRLFDLVVYGLF